MFLGPEQDDQMIRDLSPILKFYLLTLFITFIQFRFVHDVDFNLLKDSVITSIILRDLFNIADSYKKPAHP